MSMQRRHFTVLAEIVGAIEAGRVGPADVRKVLIEDLLEGEGLFKADKFDIHVDTQRDVFERCLAKSLVEGTTFATDGLILRADQVTILDPGTPDEEVRVRTFVAPRVGHGRPEADRQTVELFFRPTDWI